MHLDGFKAFLLVHLGGQPQGPPLRAGKIRNVHTEPVIENRSENEGRHFEIFQRLLFIVLWHIQLLTLLIAE